MSNSLICKDQLRVGQETRNRYIKEMENWQANLTKFTKEKKELERLLNIEQNALLQREPTSLFRAAVCTTKESSSSCNQRCNDRFSLAGGTVSPLDGARTRVKSNLSGDSCTWNWLTGEKDCNCYYVVGANTSNITTLRDALKAKTNDLNNHINNEYPKPAPIKVECCSNEMDCRGGTCLGNMQICETIVENIASTENEPQIFNNIKEVDKKITEMIKVINNVIPNISNLYNFFLKIDYTKNFMVVFEQINRIFNNVDNIYQQIFKDVQSIFQFISDLKIYVARITATSQYKNESNRILNDLVQQKSPKLLAEFRAILKIYDNIKKVYEIINKENKNYNLMNDNNNNLNKLLVIFNENIKKIEDAYTKLVNFLILYNYDLTEFKSILDHIEILIKDNEKIISDSKKKLNENEILFDTFDSDSIFKDEVIKILNNTTTVNNEMDKKFNEIINLIKNRESTYFKKIEMYERDTKLKLDEKIFQEQELSEREKEELKLALQKIIDEEMELKSILNLNNNEIIPKEPELKPKEPELKPKEPELNSGIGKLNISLIIGGAAVLLISLIFFLLRPIPIKNPN